MADRDMAAWRVLLAPGELELGLGVSIGRVTAPASTGVPYSGLPEEPRVAAEQRLSAQTVPLHRISLCDPTRLVVCHLQNGTCKSHRAVETSV